MIVADNTLCGIQKGRLPEKWTRKMPGTNQFFSNSLQKANPRLKNWRIAIINSK
jgi:hypothetical protein